MPLDLSFDPLLVSATSDELKIAYENIKQMPVELSSGNVYQFSMTDEATMRKTAKALIAMGGTVNWRRLDNSEVTYDGTALAALVDSLEQLQVQRGLVIDEEYKAFKLQIPGLTRRALATWEATYSTGFIPSLSE